MLMVNFIHPPVNEVPCHFHDFFSKMKVNIAIPLLAVYPDKAFIQKDACTPVFTAALFTITKTWKQPKCPATDKWIKKIWYIYPAIERTK